MPNAPVPAAAGGMPKFNRSQIMKAAWEHYRSAKAYVATNPYLRGTVVRFGDCLKEEWKRAKAAAARKPVSAAVAARIAALKAEILVLDCRSFRYSIGAERDALSAELAKLEAA